MKIKDRIGVSCLDCKAEWNYIRYEDKEDELVYCPNCNSLQIISLSQIVPFAQWSGMPPDFTYRCICGGIFQHPPHPIHHLERNAEKLKKASETICPFCHRSNKDFWYIPK